MKELLKHRIDALMEKAKAGDANAQLKLAHEFIKGKLVEKSVDNARYWAFKAVNGANPFAINYYNDLASGKVETIDNMTLKSIFYKFIGYLGLIPFVEMAIGIIGLIFTSSESILSTYSGILLLLGVATLILAGWLSDKLESFFSDHASEKSIFIIVLVTHALGIYIVTQL